MITMKKDSEHEWTREQAIEMLIYELAKGENSNRWFTVADIRGELSKEPRNKNARNNK